MTPNETRTEIEPDPQSASSSKQESAKGHTSEQRKSRILGWLERYALLAVLVLLFAFFSFYGPTASTIPTTANLKVVLGGQAVLAIVALGALIPLVCKEWDLSVGASAGLAAVVAAKLLSDGTPLTIALIAGVLLGVTVGTANALIITRLNTNAVITTLGTAAIVAGVVNQITGGTAQVSNIPRSLVHFGSGSVIGIPNPTLVLIVVACAVYFMLV